MGLKDWKKRKIISDNEITWDKKRPGSGEEHLVYISSKPDEKGIWYAGYYNSRIHDGGSVAFGSRSLALKYIKSYMEKN